MSFIKKALYILLGSILLSIGINYFLVPYHLLDGGMIGLGLIAKYLTGAKAGLVIIILSIPIFVFAWFYNRSYFYNSLHGMLLSSFAIDALSGGNIFNITTFDSSLMSSITGGALIGFGIGLMLRVKTSTGGTDLLAQLLSKLTHINVGVLIFIMDAFIILLGGILISEDSLVLSTITILVVGTFTTLCTWNIE